MAIVASIQGEREIERDTLHVADDATVDDAARNMSSEFLECRQGHAFPKVVRGRIGSLEDRDDGTSARRTVCPRCQCAIRVEVFQWQMVRVPKQGWQPHCVPFTEYVTYQAHPVTGESYTLPKGSGRMSPRRLRGAIVTQELDNDPGLKARATAAAKRHSKVARETARRQAAGA